MRYAIISDIHSNIQALSEADELIKRIGVDEIMCLGDIVGYNANPSECLDYVQSSVSKTIIGNHDILCSRSLKMSETVYFHPDALAGFNYSFKNLSEDQKKWLLDLPRTVRIETEELPFLLSHGNTFDVAEEFGYVLDRNAARTTLEGMKYHNVKLYFFGHTHLPTFLSTESGKNRPSPFETNFYINEAVPLAANREGLGVNDMTELIFDISGCYDKKRIAINVGSIGQPRGGYPSFGILDTKEKTVTIQYFDYNISEAQAAIRKEGYSEHIAERLGKRE